MTYLALHSSRPAQQQRSPRCCSTQGAPAGCCNSRQRGGAPAPSSCCPPQCNCASQQLLTARLACSGACSDALCTECSARGPACCPLRPWASSRGGGQAAAQEPRGLPPPLRLLPRLPTSERQKRRGGLAALSPRLPTRKCQEWRWGPASLSPCQRGEAAERGWGDRRWVWLRCGACAQGKAPAARGAAAAGGEASAVYEAAPLHYCTTHIHHAVHAQLQLSAGKGCGWLASVPCLGSHGEILGMQAHRHRQELSAEGSQDAQQAQAPAWLANSQKWLKSAGKKVAQAAKETTATLQARLEEFEQAHRPTHKGAVVASLRLGCEFILLIKVCQLARARTAGHEVISFILGCPPSPLPTRHKMCAASLLLTSAAWLSCASLRAVGRCALLRCAGGAERANSFSESDAPAYFHDWAAKIESMPPDRAASTLDALAEQDRLRVQRIIDENAMERTRARGSPRSPNLPSTRSRRLGRALASCPWMCPPCATTCHGVAVPAGCLQVAWLCAARTNLVLEAWQPPARAPS